jgi:hypothetical protein
MSLISKAFKPNGFLARGQAARTNWAAVQSRSSGKRTPCLVVNQANQIQLVGHRRELATDGLPGQKKSTVAHDRNFAIGARPGVFLVPKATPVTGEQNANMNILHSLRWPRVQTLPKRSFADSPRLPRLFH